MSPRLVMKRLQSNCQARRTTQPNINPPELPIFTTIRNTFGRTTLNSARRWENFACRQASTRQQLHFLHECLRQNILPPSVNYRPPLNHPQAWAIARQNGRRMTRMLIADAHNRISRYRTKVSKKRHNVDVHRPDLGQS